MLFSFTHYWDLLVLSLLLDTLVEGKVPNMEYIGHALIIIGLVFILLTIIGLEKHKDFSKRVLISSLTDSTALILIILGLVLVNPMALTNFKLLLILVLNLILSPVLINIVINNYGGRR